MIKQIWLNIPVKDIQKAKQFYSQIGFAFDEEHDTEFSTCMLAGTNNFVIMLFEESMFTDFIKNPIIDASKGSEVLLSVDVESWEEVDAMAYKVEEAGGVIFSEPTLSQAWMYGFGFVDIDGHRWSVLHMDYSKLS